MDEASNLFIETSIKDVVMRALKVLSTIVYRGRSSYSAFPLSSLCVSGIALGTLGVFPTYFP